MATPSTRKVLNVFLASPSDVAAERQIAEEVTNELNKIIRQLGWQLDLHKWEDTAPGYGRPQAKINAAVDSCQLFIGLLWERWGQPTGAYSSGFEEEFELARKRRRTDPEPEIWLVFKDLDAERLKDPGPQLTKVLEFRKTQAALGEILFKEIRDTSDWRSKLQTWLMSHIIDLVTPQLSAVPETLPTTPPIQVSDRVAHPLPENTSTAKAAGSGQLVELVGRLSEVVGAKQIEFVSVDEKNFHEFDVVRLYLLAETLMSTRHTHDVLGTHEINLLYKHRDKLNETSTERYELLRTVVSDNVNVKPGWFWLRNLKAEIVREALVQLATRDNNTIVRGRALKLLKSAKIILSQDRWLQLPFWDDTAATRFDAYNYLASLDQAEAISFLEGLGDTEENSAYSVAATRAALTIKLRLDPNQAVSTLIGKPQLLSDDLLTAVRASISNVEDKILLDAAQSSDDRIRTMCIEELVKRNNLPKPLAQSLTSDNSASIRALAFDVLVRMGESVDMDKLRGLGSPLGNLYDSDPMILRVFETYSAGKLQDSIDWYSVDGPLAYKVLALKHFDRISGDIRTDIQNGFTRIKKASEARLRSVLGAQADTIVKNFEEKLDSFVALSFLQAGLEGLAASAQPSDVDIARKYLSDPEWRLQSAAVDIVAKFGGASDVTALLHLANSGYDSVPSKAASAALLLSENPLGTVGELVKATKADVVGVAFRWLVEHPSTQVTEYCRGLLAESDDSNRVRAVYCLSRTLCAEEIQKLLEDYISMDSYFYNVVTWLDRLLYSPSPLREMFESRLAHVL